MGSPGSHYFSKYYLVIIIITSVECSVHIWVSEQFQLVREDDPVSHMQS